MPAPFCFAWVNANETTFGPEHEVEDEEIDAFIIEHDEGEIPRLTITFLNPRVGPLAPGRKQWAWLSWHNGSAYQPIFFGQIVSVPDSILGEVVTYVLTSQATNYGQQKSELADTMRVAPYYDPVFFDLARRDDPDAVLEGYSSRWHIDRTTLDWSASDIITGEDGTETFAEGDVPYDSVSLKIGQSPLYSVTIDATVNWTQVATGVVDMGPKAFVSYSGDGIVADWPKPAADVGGGWACETSAAIDVYNVATAMTATWSYSYTNKSKKHKNGDVLSQNVNATEPQLGPHLSGELTRRIQTGALAPYEEDGQGNYTPINIPPETAITSIHCPLWQINTALVLRYNAERTRSERLLFNLGADLQPIVTAPTALDVGKIVTVSGGDVGVPILPLLNWTSVRNTAVSLGQIIFPNYPAFPGSKIPQIVTTAGTTGTALPEFSPTTGVTTADGTATWTSLGDATPNATPPEWQAQTEIALGTIILPRAELGVITYAMLTQPGLLQFPQAGVSVSVGQLVRSASGSYQVCKLSGTTATRSGGYSIGMTGDYLGVPWRYFAATPVEPAFSSTWGVEAIDGSVTWFSLGMTAPSGQHHYICRQAGITGQFRPPFGLASGSSTTDGTVVWTNIGAASVPVGGVLGNVPARSYFPSDRGRQSIEYLICLARSHLLQRSRAVEITFDCRFSRAVALSCRKNALLEDRRLPGGEAFGKIIAYKLECDGKSGVMKGSVTIGCAVGSGATVSEIAGTPVYVEAGVIDDVQLFEGSQIVLPEVGDVGYTPPVQTTVDDGLVFPLKRAQIVRREVVRGTLEAQAVAIQDAFLVAKDAATLSEITPQSADQSVEIQRQTAILSARSVSQALQENPIWYDIELRPVSGAAFHAEYSLGVTDLVIPRMIDLEAA